MKGNTLDPCTLNMNFCNMSYERRVLAYLLLQRFVQDVIYIKGLQPCCHHSVEEMDELLGRTKSIVDDYDLPFLKSRREKLCLDLCWVPKKTITVKDDRVDRDF